MSQTDEKRVSRGQRPILPTACRQQDADTETASVAGFEDIPAGFAALALSRDVPTIDKEHLEDYRTGVRTARFLLLLTVWPPLTGGCKADGSQARWAPPPAAAAACRSPREAGCSRCCDELWLEDPADRRLGISSCRIRSYDPNAPAQQSRDVLYNRADVRAGPCAPQCAPCADCTEDEERAYRRIEAMGCDCLAPQPASLDPCFTDGCLCLCSQFAPLAACRAYDPASGLGHAERRTR